MAFLSLLAAALGAFFSPVPEVRPALAAGVPFMTVAVVLVHTRRYQLGGWILSASFYVMATLIFFRYDRDGTYTYVVLFWLSLAFLMTTSWAHVRDLVILAVWEMAYLVAVTFVSTAVGWVEMILFLWVNTFAIAVSFAYVMALRHYGTVVERGKAELEKQVQARTIDLERLVEERETLLKELYHRTKNNMQVISSLISLQASTTENDESRQALGAAESRIRAMALVHEHLYQSDNLRSVDLDDYVSDLAQRIAALFLSTEIRMEQRLHAPDAFLSMDTAIPIGLVLNELITNAFKYSIDGGSRVVVETSLPSPDQLEIAVEDDGPGVSGTPSSTGSLGLSLVNSIIEKQLRGTVTFVAREAGTRVEIRIPR